MLQDNLLDLENPFEIYKACLTPRFLYIKNDSQPLRLFYNIYENTLMYLSTIVYHA